MTAESAILNVLPEMGVDAAAIALSDGSFQSRQMLALMNATGRDIAGRGEWQQLFRTFSADATGTALPADYARLTEAGAVWSSTGIPVRQVVAPEQWAFLGRRPSSQPYFMLRQGKIVFAGLTGTATVHYVSNNWVGGAKAAVTENADSFVFPDRVMETGLLARWRRQKGLPYDDFLAEHEAEVESALKADRGLR